MTKGGDRKKTAKKKKNAEKKEANPGGLGDGFEVRDESGKPVRTTGDGPKRASERGGKGCSTNKPAYQQLPHGGENPQGKRVLGRREEFPFCQEKMATKEVRIGGKKQEKGFPKGTSGVFGKGSLN